MKLTMVAQATKLLSLSKTLTNNIAISVVIFLPCRTKTFRRFPAKAKSTNTVIHATMAALAATITNNNIRSTPKRGSSTEEQISRGDHSVKLCVQEKMKMKKDTKTEKNKNRKILVVNLDIDRFMCIEQKKTRMMMMKSKAMMMCGCNGVCSDYIIWLMRIRIGKELATMCCT